MVVVMMMVMVVVVVVVVARCVRVAVLRTLDLPCTCTMFNCTRMTLALLHPCRAPPCGTSPPRPPSS